MAPRAARPRSELDAANARIRQLELGAAEQREEIADHAMAEAAREHAPVWMYEWNNVSVRMSERIDV